MHHSIDILNKRMDRREFLQTLLIILLTFIGLGFLLKHTSSTPARPGGSAATQPNADNTYGG